MPMKWPDRPGSPEEQEQAVTGERIERRLAHIRDDFRPDVLRADAPTAPEQDAGPASDGPGPWMDAPDIGHELLPIEPQPTSAAALDAESIGELLLPRASAPGRSPVRTRRSPWPLVITAVLAVVAVGGAAVIWVVAPPPGVIGSPSPRLASPPAAAPAGSGAVEASAPILQAESSATLGSPPPTGNGSPVADPSGGATEASGSLQNPTPTNRPTVAPSPAPATPAPTPSPTNAPTPQPTPRPTAQPTAAPQPTAVPVRPTPRPTPTRSPSGPPVVVGTPPPVVVGTPTPAP